MFETRHIYCRGLVKTTKVTKQSYTKPRLLGSYSLSNNNFSNLVVVYIFYIYCTVSYPVVYQFPAQQERRK